MPCSIISFKQSPVGGSVRGYEETMDLGSQVKKDLRLRLAPLSMAKSNFKL
jgi:hypothetical protein